MKEIFRDSNLARVELFRTILEGADIPCIVHNAATQQSIVGGLVVAFLPLPDFYPKLSVLEDADYPEAMNLLRDSEPADPLAANEWICPNCASDVPGHFDRCWNCDSERETSPEPR
jgi:hypothetical protein